MTVLTACNINELSHCGSHKASLILDTSNVALKPLVTETHEPFRLLTCESNVSRRNNLSCFVNNLVIKVHRDSANKVNHINNVIAGCRNVGVNRDSEVLLNGINYVLYLRHRAVLAVMIDAVEFAAGSIGIIRQTRVTGNLQDIQLCCQNIKL